MIWALSSYSDLTIGHVNIYSYGSLQEAMAYRIQITQQQVPLFTCQNQRKTQALSTLMQLQKPLCSFGQKHVIMFSSVQKHFKSTYTPH